ncbi:DUF1294 domain-containing protein [Kordiimonas sp. SCSIO 12603]|uniref:DUF1294 domain-containing protein n=1 Tax=Kordiimonas sp. SCSIO 12603 TaxID=2829596 RepID=UPI002106FB07|nr:DUF1294 domain-containing protein [Kordiimonas sp. SCSIO 12603]UTW60257.1 DUF1294 domain-containing protein [Kordiimonas sp. SCSIO 12603]
MNITLIITAYFGTLSFITLCMYGWDKRASIKGNWRVKENTLHLFAILGGWPGAICGQKLFRHKTKKRSFRIRFFATCFINIAASIWLYQRFIL